LTLRRPHRESGRVDPRSRMSLSWTGLSACYALGASAASVRLSRHHDRPVVRWYMAASLVALGAQLLLTALILRGHRRAGAVTSPPFPSLADAVTLGRAATGAHALGLAVAARRTTTPLTGPLCWAPLLVAVTVADWGDGWCARRMGQDTQRGAVLDVETDSWLTFCCACVAVTVGGLPGYAAFTPLARHALFWHSIVQDIPAPVRFRGSWWERTIGTAQMAVLLGGLTRRKLPGTTLLRSHVGLVSLLSAVSMALQWTPSLTQRDKNAPC
jgi:phosphatidylglycerophosphate synthase